MTDEKVIVKDQGRVERNAVFRSIRHRSCPQGFNGNTPLVPLALPANGFNPNPGDPAQLQAPRRLAFGIGAVIASMVVLFVAPLDYFAAATFFSTGCMLSVAYSLGAISKPARLNGSAIGFGLATAGVLYLVFYAGGWAVDTFHPFGITSASEASVYSLIASPSNPLYLQVALLLFDSAGFEAFFRGALQSRLQAKIGPAAAPAVALVDACIHVVTLNPIWVGGTFLTDLVWGLTYYYGKGLQGSFASHFVWDIAIFIVRPVT